MYDNNSEFPVNLSTYLTVIVGEIAEKIAYECDGKTISEVTNIFASSAGGIIMQIHLRYLSMMSDNIIDNIPSEKRLEGMQIINKVYIMKKWGLKMSNDKGYPTNLNTYLEVLVPEIVEKTFSECDGKSIQEGMKIFISTAGGITGALQSKFSEIIARCVINDDSISAKDKISVIEQMLQTYFDISKDALDYQHNMIISNLKNIFKKHEGTEDE